MSEAAENQTEQQTNGQGTGTESGKTVKLDGLYAFKVGMSSVYDENGEATPVTVLKYEPWFVTQIKTADKDGYSAIQVACMPKKATRTSKAELGHMKGSGFENGARYKRELRQDAPEGLQVGQRVELESLAKGDTVRLTGTSKGRGFAGVMKRWDFGGGPASHGAGFHRKPGSIGNRTWPGRVIPGKKMAGHFGDETVTVRNVKVVEVIPEENVVLVKGPVPGARNSLVKLMKV